MVISKKLLPAALLTCSLLVPSLSFAQTSPPAPAASSVKMPNKDDAAMLERHIAHMHDELKVTADQEDSWKPVAQTMRDNEMTMHALYQEKRSKIDSQSAVEDLNAYADIAAAHAAATKKLADSFSTFYASLSDAQKKLADTMFREHKKHHGMGGRDHPMPKN